MIKKVYTPEDARQIEKAIIFMTEAFKKENRNEKPVVLHSIKVGTDLMNFGAANEIVMAGFLHDLIEDSCVLKEEIEQKFGKQVAELVDAMTRDLSIDDYQACWLEYTDRLEKFGQDALIIKIADALDNLNYIDFIENPEKKKEVLWKHEIFYKIAKNYLNENLMFLKYEEILKSKVNR